MSTSSVPPLSSFESELDPSTSKLKGHSPSVRRKPNGTKFCLYPLYPLESSLKTLGEVREYQAYLASKNVNDEGFGISSRNQVFSDRSMGGCCSLETLLAYVVPDALELGLSASRFVTRQFDEFLFSLHDMINERFPSERIESYMFNEVWRSGAINRFKRLVSQSVRENCSNLEMRKTLTVVAREFIGRASGIVRNLQDTCYILNYRRPVCWDTVFFRYFLLDMGDLSIANLKYHSLWLSGQLRACLPVRKASITDLDGFLIDRRFRSTCIQVMHRCGFKAWLWSETLLQGLKRGFPSMSSTQAKKELENFVSEMEKPLVTTQRLIDAVKRTSGEILRDLSIPSQPFVFSHSAGVGAPCADFGMYGAVLRRQSESVWSFILASDELVMMKEERDFSVVEVRSVPPDHYWSRWLSILLSRRVQEKFHDTIDPELLTRPEIDWEGLIGKYPSLAQFDLRSFTEDELEQFLHQSPLLGVQSAGIFEPLKLRVITKGDPEFYSLLKPLQVAMWSCLRKFPNFGLIGERLGPEILEQLVIGPSGQMFESADYVGSTNNLSMALTMACVTSLPTPFLRQLATLTVGPQFIIESGGWQDRFEKGKLVPKMTYELHLQRRGQLMGSPISFPILCIINAAVARLTFELRFGRSFELSELPFLVNGDDFVARWDAQAHSIYETLVREVGWDLSPGKSFFSDRFIQINSETKKVRWVVGQDGFDRPVFDTSVPYVNMGFVEMLGKDVMSLSSSQRIVCSGLE